MAAPGPEEAWARMPKGERMEDDSIVWCKEERLAYGACRSLLLDGDQIAARMAFKERYERELAESRSQGTPVQWTVSGRLRCRESARRTRIGSRRKAN